MQFITGDSRVCLRTRLFLCLECETGFCLLNVRHRDAIKKRQDAVKARVFKRQVFEAAR
jgi:hypothetical protein